MTALRQLLRQRVEEYSIADPSVETFVTVRLYGKGAVRRKVAEGKTPVMRKGYRLVAGDLVYSRIDARNGAFALVPPELNGAVVSKNFPCFAIKSERVDASLLIRYLTSEQFYRQLRAVSFGTTNRQPVGEQDFLDHEIPLPPLQEQERIVSILDEADGLRALRAQAEERTGSLRAALFEQMFGAREETWPKEKFGNVGNLDRGRSQHRPRDEPSLFGGQYPFIQTGDVANSSGRITTFTQTYSERGLAQSRLWPAGTLCITIAANIARTGVLAFDACFPDSVVGFIPGARVTVEYVQAWLGTIQKALEDEAPQAAQKNINLRILRELDLLVPPLELQRAFAARVAEIRELEVAQAPCHQRLGELLSSVLYRALQGEL